MPKLHYKLLSILVLICVTLSCSPNYELKNIQTGIANFQITNDRNESIFSYAYFSTFQNIPQVAFAINNLQSRNIQFQNFYIIPSNRTISQIYFLMTHKQGWNLITINFILSTRNDLVLESFAINLNQQISKNLIVQIKPKYYFEQFTSKIFLNGFQMNPLIKKDNLTTTLDISVRLVSFTQQNLQMDFTGNSFKQIKMIYLSYVMIQVGNKAYISDQGSISIENLKGVQSRDLQRSFIQSQYKLHGINSLNFQGNIIALISSIKSDLSSTIYSTTLINSLVIDYFILSNNPKNICNCEDKTLRYSFNNSCLFSCPQNTFAYLHPEGGYMCLLKPVQIINPVMNKILYDSTINIFPQLIENQSLSVQQISNLNKNQSSVVSISNLCQSQIKNSYFDGKSCSCITGFKNVSNQCLPFNSTQQKLFNTNSSNILILSCSGFNEVNLNGTCTCINGYQRIKNQCVLKQNITCGPNSFLNGNQCICLLGYIKTSNNTCQLKNTTQVICQENQINNGLNICICQQGYFNVSGQCVKDKPCPINSVKTQDGNCTCLPNFFNISGQCSTCPLGQYWLSSISKCVQFCGQNSIKNNNTGKCECIPTFGISKNNICQYCPLDKFILNNYCVSCPQNQYYNKTLGRCQCKQQFHMQINGLCLQKCPNNQYYDSVDKVCKCLFNLGRLNGVCQICPKNYYVRDLTQQCLPCGEGSISSQGKCVCKSQFTLDIFGKCVACGSVPNTFMYKGRCSTCAGQKIYNGTACICPIGTVFRNLKCIKICKDHQLMDEKGNCYKCPVNEIIFNNQCVCRKNYQRINDTCQLVCPPGSFNFKDKCSVCPGNKIYDPQINGCVCPNGFYLNVNNQCQRLSLSLIQCPLGQYLDMERGCTNCISSCEKCQNTFTCLKCQSPYFLTNGKCKDICGNGVLQSGQQCDDKNMKDGDGCSSTCKIDKNFKCSGTPSICIFTIPEIKCGNGMIQTNQQCDDYNVINNDGCSSLCKTQRMFTCYGQPSICKYNATYHICGNGFVQYSQQCDDGNFNNNDGCNFNCTTEIGFMCTNQPSICVKNIATGMVMYGKINYNLNNIYISVQTDQKYQFNSNAEMETFIKVLFVNTTYKPSSYCTQRQYPELDIFDCLLLYSSGIPNKAFKVQFSYTSPANNKVIQLQIDVDPLAVQSERIKNLRRT